MERLRKRCYQLRMVMMRKQYPPKKRNYRRWLVIAALLAFLAVPLANQLARFAAEKILASLFSGDASIEKVRLGFQRISINGLTVHSPERQQPTIAMERMTADLTLLSGFTKGVWIEKIVVVRPEMNVHFNEAGELVTTLPQGNTAEKEAKPLETLPFGLLEVSNAHFGVHQVGKKSLDVDGIELRIESKSSRANVACDIPRILSSKLQFRSIVDLASLEAKTEIRLPTLSTTTHELVQWPLVPREIDAHPLSLNAGIYLQQSGSLKGTKNLNLAAILEDAVVSHPDRPGLLQGDVSANLSHEQFVVQSSGKLLGGTFGFSCAGALHEAIQASVELKCRQLDLKRVPPKLLADVSGVIDADAQINITLHDNLVSLKGNAETRSGEFKIAEVAVAPTDLMLNVDGAIDLKAAKTRSFGSLQLRMTSEGVGVDQLASLGRKPTLAEDDSIASALAKSNGRLRAAARATIPLATMDAPETVSAVVVMDATGVEFSGLEVTQGRGSVRLLNGELQSDFRDLTIVDTVNDQVSSVSLLAEGQLSKTSPIRIQCRVNQLSIPTLARFAYVGDRKLDGQLMASAVLHCSADRLANPDAWYGNAVVQARSIQVDELLLAHCELQCQLTGGVASLNQLSGVLAGGAMSGTGKCQIVPPYAFATSTECQGLDIARIVAIVGQRSQKDVAGQLSVSIVANGAIEDQEFQANGNLDGSNLRFGAREFGDTKLAFSGNPNEILFQSPAQGFLGGDLLVRVAELQEKEDGAGFDPMITGRLTDIPLPALVRLAGVEERMEGEVSCEFVASSLADLENLKAQVAFGSQAISVRNTTVKELTGNISMTNGIAEGKATAFALGGEIDLQASTDVAQLLEYTPSEGALTSDLPVDMLAAVVDVKLQELWPVLDQREQLRPLAGRVTATVQRSASHRQQGTLADGELRLHDLRWKTRYGRTNFELT